MISLWGRQTYGLILRDKNCCLVSKSCPSLCDLLDCRPPGSSVHGISQEEYWSELPFPFPGHLSKPGIEPTSPALAGRCFTTQPLGKPEREDCRQVKGTAPGTRSGYSSAGNSPRPERTSCCAPLYSGGVSSNCSCNCSPNFSFLIPTQNLGKNSGKNFLLRTHHCQGPEELNKLLRLIN